MEQFIILVIYLLLQKQLLEILYITADGKFKVVSPVDWSADLGTAVGVCVIPTSHNVYDDGSCAILSLRQATRKQWGGYGKDIDDLTDITTVPIVGNITTQAPIETANYCFLPSNKFNNEANALDNGTAWASEIDPSKHCPSLFASDGSRNTSINVGALNDFDGINNTSKIITKLTELDETDRAAQVAKAMTNGGLTWYLPAMGELAYIIPRFNQINEGLSKVGTQMGESVSFWSSSEYNVNLAWRVDTFYGYVTYANKHNGNSVLGFARVTLD